MTQPRITDKVYDMTNNEERSSEVVRLPKWVVVAVLGVMATLFTGATAAGLMAWNELSVLKYIVEDNRDEMSELNSKFEEETSDRFTGADGAKHDVRIREVEGELNKRSVRITQLETRYLDLQRRVEKMENRE